jgi:uncharacterized protein (TIGR04255 family)
MTARKLPKFRKPPVTEVLCCIYFQDLVNLHAPHLGALWQALGSEYSRTQTAMPLPPVNFSLASLGAFLAQSFQAAQADQFQLPRTWFINTDDTALVQVQRDRFVFNWKQNHKQNPYPSYDVVIADFRKLLEVFAHFVADAKVGPLSLIGTELTYINHFIYGRELKGPSSIEAVLPLFEWHVRSNSAFRQIAELNWNTQFELPNDDGRFYFTVQTAQRRQDGSPLVKSDLSVRKLAPQIAPESIWPWFDRAHEHIVTSFADITSPEVQEKVWEKYQ